MDVLSEEQQRRYVAAIIHSSWVQGPLSDDEVYEALVDVLQRARLPREDLARWYELERSVEPHAGGSSESWASKRNAVERSDASARSAGERARASDALRRQEC